MFVVLFLSSFKREESFQMFVHGAKEDRPLVLTLRQDEPGRALKEAVHKQCPSLPSYFILLFRGRKVCRTVIWVRRSWESVSSCLASHTVPNRTASSLANGVDVAKVEDNCHVLRNSLTFFSNAG